MGQITVCPTGLFFLTFGTRKKGIQIFIKKEKKKKKKKTRMVNDERVLAAQATFT